MTASKRNTLPKFDVTMAAREVGEIVNGTLLGKVKLSESVAALVAGSKFDTGALDTAVAVAIGGLTAEMLHKASPEARARSVIASTVNSVLKARSSKYADLFTAHGIDAATAPDKFSWKDGFTVSPPAPPAPEPEVGADGKPLPATVPTVTPEQADEMIAALIANGHAERMMTALTALAMAEAEAEQAAADKKAARAAKKAAKKAATTA